MTPPAWFVDQMARDFGDRLRIRWSPALGEWHIEQKVGRGAALPQRHIDPRDGAWIPIEYDDSYIRAREGYGYVLSIRPGDRMPCPSCFSTLRVPVMEFAEIRCPHCLAKGRDVYVRASYWPLSESLLDHLRLIDPLRGAALKLAAEADKANHAREAAIDKKASNERYDGLYDEIVRQIPSVGYTGKEQYL